MGIWIKRRLNGNVKNVILFQYCYYQMTKKSKFVNQESQSIICYFETP